MTSHHIRADLMAGTQQSLIAWAEADRRSREALEACRRTNVRAARPPRYRWLAALMRRDTHPQRLTTPATATQSQP